MIRIGICEDEKEIQDLIETYLHSILKSINIDYEIKKYNLGEELLESNLKEIDILLLDIQMGQINGMDTARKIRKVDNKMEIIFITSLIDYVQEGYEVRAYRYLLKPIEEEELKKHVLTCIKEIENKNSYILIKNKSNNYKICLEEIKYIEVQKKNMIIHTINKDFDVIYSLEKIEKDLKLDKFVRCHKSFLVNLSYVENIKLNTAILESGEEVPVSRYRYKEVKEKFLKFLGDSIC
ncbi:two-component response regulator VirR-like [[Clostridium] sordellii]|uniref:Stage 0 sporulation protein A homolog n=1 Tax=Paraclostridium sordellii TaxID=1505 RepID=A0ABP1XQA6_PARSO|nr:LytTR family DNA-binding domain-containing protein [Paeniclostridium sordellii]EPZ57292.1 response regulator [[Clostridium] sordellii ATCC 9714] [Paeniclostridium sordellii ATCC 9714]CEJ73526.1 Two-component response regulator VirR-like [[Clostridium] sordellii] [Paeniclostridium sordellii]CEN69076.1 two-component response regulator VirR-like [[Clostridium] sordellii] [Paeniclostridium sordellii]CEN72344.1 two-component response regulator VirR-like [[Clostridium] sordellii] [Paeniclostridium